MLETTPGTLTVIDANTSTPKYYWKGEVLNHVKSIMLMNTEGGGENRCLLRVTNPTKVTPALPQNVIDRLNLIYSEMNTSNIKVIKL